MPRPASTAPDKWEVVRYYADGTRPNVTTTHKSPELADAAYRKALTEDFYAVDVLFLPHGRTLDFEPMYGTANGFAYTTWEQRAVYAAEWLNEVSA